MRKLILVMLVTLAACSTQAPLTETDISANILGEWRYSSDDAPLDFAHWFIFKNDEGKSTSGECRSSRGNGVWRLSGTTLHIKIVDVEYSLEGIDANYNILSLSSKQLVLKNAEDAETYTLNRK